MSLVSVILFIAAALCFAYGLVVKMAGSGTMFFVVWLAIGVLLLLFALSLRSGLWGRVPFPLRTMILVLAGAVLAAVIAVEVFVIGSFRAEGRDGLRYVIVLGAQVRDDGPSKALAYRLDRAYDYLTENSDTVCIVSGGQGYNEPVSEASAMKEYLVQRGIAEERILEEDKSTNTNENIILSRKLINEEGDGSDIGIITNNFHVFRAVSIAKKQGLTGVCGIAAPSDKTYLLNNTFREFFGVAKDLIRGNM